MQDRRFYLKVWPRLVAASKITASHCWSARSGVRLKLFHWFRNQEWGNISEHLSLQICQTIQACDGRSETQTRRKTSSRAENCYNHKMHNFTHKLRKQLPPFLHPPLNLGHIEGKIIDQNTENININHNYGDCNDNITQIKHIKRKIAHPT